MNENQNKQIYALKQELIAFRSEVENTFLSNSLYMFDKTSRKRFEITLIALKEILRKEILRKQISLVYAMKQKDIVVFLNNKIFLKSFVVKK